MAETYRICPVCETRNHPHVSVCMQCGASLSAQPAFGNTDAAYDFRVGAADLMERALRRRANRAFAMMAVVLLIIMGLGLALIAAPNAMNRLEDLSIFGAAGDAATPTLRPTLSLATVTPAPPTPTPSETLIPTATATATPTQEPCMRQVTSNDTLYALAASCGHTSFDVLQLIVKINDLADANSITIGQVLEIPWPTPTPGPESPTPAENANAGQTLNVSDNSSASAGESTEESSAFDEDFDPLFVPTATLRPGVQFHIVSSGETMISIAQIYGATAEIISQLNPEIPFNGCDFGERYGGPRCVVNLSINMQVRVPAPTPTPTLSPTPNGSETATPSVTPTFNAPVLQSPRDRALFRANELVTLRWVPSGTLGPGETYRVNVEDLTDGELFIADTTSTFYILPAEWQGRDDQRHEYRWHITIINTNNPSSPVYTTEMLTFTWQGRGDNS